MKSLILALLFFAVVLYGCYDVRPFKALRRGIRRTPRSQTGPLGANTGPLDGMQHAETGPLARALRKRPY